MSLLWQPWRLQLPGLARDRTARCHAIFASNSCRTFRQANDREKAELTQNPSPIRFRRSNLDTDRRGHGADALASSTWASHVRRWIDGRFYGRSGERRVGEG